MDRFSKPSTRTIIFVSRKADRTKVEQLCFKTNNDRIWLLWNNGGLTVPQGVTGLSMIREHFIC